MSWTIDLPRLDTSTTVNSLVQLIIQLMGHMIKKSNSLHIHRIFLGFMNFIRKMLLLFDMHALVFLD